MIKYANIECNHGERKQNLSIESSIKKEKEKENLIKERTFWIIYSHNTKGKERKKR